MRAQLTFEPSESFDLWLKVEGGRDKSETSLGYTRALFDPNTGDFCAQAYAGRHDETNCVALSNLTNAFALTPGDPGLLPDRQKEDGTKVMSKPINALDNRWTGVNLQMNWDLEFATLTSITGYLDYENNQVYDFDAQPLTLFEEDGSADLTSWSQELRLISNGDGPLNWLAGAMVAEDEVDEDRLGDLRDNVLVFSTLSRRGFVQETESWAVYGQVDYALNESWLVSASLRYTEEEKDLNDAFMEDLVDDFFYIRDVHKSYELDENWSGHIGLDWTPNDDALIYARVTQGFKSGGFFGGFALSAEELDPYGEETVLSYEIGFKTTWADNTLQLNGAAYYYDYRDVQGFTQEFNNVTGTVVTKLGNLGDAEHTGAELDLLWLPLDGLTLQAAVSWLDAEITDSDTISLSQEELLVPLEGLKRAFAPEWSANVLARYEWNIASLLASAQVNYSWRDDLINEDSELSPVNLAAFSHDAYGVVNARLSIGAEDEGWTLALIGKNLTDEEYWARTSSDDLLSYPSSPARPASWMVEATYQW